MKKTRIAFTFALALFFAAPAFAQQLQRDAKPPAVGARQAAKTAITPNSSTDAKTAFTALAEADRKAVQDGLGWLGFYNGTVDGAYGKRTIDALMGYQRSLDAAADGIVTSKQLAGLKEGAAKAKAAVGFKLFDDPVTGVRIGAPTKLVEKRAAGAGVTSYASKDGEIALEMRETSGKLAALYRTLTADAAGRKISYKVIKPDALFVIAGEEGDKKFYRRFAAAPADAADPNKLRGFGFAYPKARATALDPVALAIANSFEAFPAAPLPAPPTPIASATPSPTPAPEPPKLSATALVIAPGVAVTALGEARCKAPTIDGMPVWFLEGAGELSRLGGDFGAGAAAPSVGQGSDDLVALSVAPAGDERTTLEVSPVRSATASGGGKVIAALGAGGPGAPLFDRQGRLVAFVAPFEAAKTRAGVALAEPHATIPATGVGESGAAQAGEAPLSAAEIAAKMRGAVVGVFCGA